MKSKFSQAVHTPQYAAFRRAMRLARLSRRPGMPPFDELIEMRPSPTSETAGPNGWTRRRFLKTSGAAALTLAGGGLLTSCVKMKGAPRIVVVGAGIAGLEAAYRLKQAGYVAEVYEAAKRVGGRLYSVKDAIAPGLVTEFGASFIDSDHDELLSLVEEFGLGLLDLAGPGENELEEVYIFDGKRYTTAQLGDTFRSLAALMEDDVQTVEKAFGLWEEGDSEGARSLMAPIDELSAAEYLERAGASGDMRAVFAGVYVPEMGLDFDRMSAVSAVGGMLWMDLDAEPFALFGEDYARYTVAEGCQAIAHGLAERIEGQVKLGHRLEAVRSKGDGFVLTFQDPNGAAVDVEADFVIMTVPFSVLRDIEMRMEMPDIKRKAIAELGHGMSPKLQVGFNKRVWRESGLSGTTYSSEPFQSAWDDSQLRGGEAGCLTIYPGGREGVKLGEGTAAEQVERLMPGVEKSIPGVSAELSGKAERFHWPSYPFALCGYSNYTVGQWTTIAGSEAEPVGNMFFAGEHCSGSSFVNSAAESGKSVAEALAAHLGKNANKPKVT
ncbi:MAG: FAD-dependent oxidoreductase [Acidobacteriota bacterium]|nr:MAG: FAD-dependent oxidoreductase [Acidobacteriota bacterium]